MINKMSTLLKVDTTEPFCNRAKLDTGTQCNYNCWFCYYKDKLDKPTSLSVIKERVDYLVECGITEVDLSGGESSIHKDWFEIIKYCKSKGLKVSTISNGSMFSDYGFIEKSKGCGLDEILFSLHGYDEKSHNLVVGNNNAFKNIIDAIRNANEIGVVVRINCVVTDTNYNHLQKEFVDLIHSFDCIEVNFLTLNFWGDTGMVEEDIVDYRSIAVGIQRSIDRLDVRYINVRYIPYCFMVGYEKYVCNVYQHIYDIYDWNMAVYDGLLKPEKYKGKELECLYGAAVKDRVNHYHKSSECIRCKYFYLCDGLENDIINQKVYPVEGERLRDVNYYRKGFYEY